MHRRSFLASILAAPALSLEAQPSIRPRLFLDADKVALLQAAIESTHARLWAAVRADADSYARTGPPAYPADPAKDDEQLWQREVGNKLPFLAISHLLTGESRYLQAAAEWSMASCRYPTWGTGRYDGVDLAAGHQLFGLAMVYDWLHTALPAEVLTTIRRTLLARGAAMFQAARGGAYWRNSFLQNHLWVNAAGLAAAGLALREFDVSPWLDLAREKFQLTEDSLGPDGASHEGSPYWSYGVEYMLKYWHLAGAEFGETPAGAWWPNTAAYRLYLGLPRHAWAKGNVSVDVADGPRSDYYGPDYLLRRLAALYRDSNAQWLAGELDRAGFTQYSARWLNLIWYDPDVEESSPILLPTLRHFEDIGIVSARTDWSGDESMLVFRCGPPLGHEAVDKFSYDAGAGHVHPDANHFVLFGSGEWLVRDDGYAWKQTDQHNTLLIDGNGQLGEGAQWFRGLDAIRPRARPRILKADAGPEFDEIAGDATAIYPPASGLKRYLRRLFFWKPDILLAIDEIETDRPRNLELRFHPEYPAEASGDSEFLCRGPKATLRITSLTPDGVSAEHGMTPGRDRDGNPMRMFAVRFAATRAAWRNATALSWCAAGSMPAQVTLDVAGDCWVFRAGERQLTWWP